MNAACTGCSAETDPSPSRGGDRLALRIRDGRQAGAHRAAVDQHIAGAALTEAATEFCCGEAEAAQPVEQRLVGVRGFDRALEPVDAKSVVGHETPRLQKSF